MPTHYPKRFSKRRQWPRRARWLIGSAIGWLVLSAIAPEVAQANSWPPMAVPLFHLPLVASLISFGLGLFGIVAVETLTIARREKLPLSRVLMPVFGANILSSIAGMAFTLGMAMIPYLNDGGWETTFIGSLVLIILILVGFATQTSLKKLTPWPSGSRWLWGVLWLLMLIVGVMIIGVINTALNWWLKIPLAIAYFAIGWIMSWVTEGACLAKLLPNPGIHLGQSIAIANLRSYVYVAIPIIFFVFLRTIHLVR
ncbi:MAG TPA: hypothetical protein V6D46_06345 [Coleofasciculaceae cyanobacterium]